MLNYVKTIVLACVAMAAGLQTAAMSQVADAFVAARRGVLPGKLYTPPFDTAHAVHLNFMICHYI